MFPWLELGKTVCVWTPSSCWPSALRRSGVYLSSIPLLPYAQVLGRHAGASLCIFLSGSQGSFFPLAPPLSPPGRRKGNCHQSPYLYKKTVCFLCQKKHRKGAVSGEGTQPQTLRGQFIFCRHGLGTPTALAVGDAV